MFFYWNKTFFVNTERETMLEKKTISEILRFGVTGCVATLVHYLVYYVLMTFINTSVAFTIGYIVSFVLNYIMSARLPSERKRRHVMV